MNRNSKITKNFKGIVDTTLREGMQYLNANFSRENQKKIFDFLSLIGVDYIELSNPANPKIKELSKYLLKKRVKSKTKVVTHIRNKFEDLQNALDLKTDGVNILVTTDPERLKSMDVDISNHLDKLRKNIYIAQENNLEVRISVEDCFNQPSDRILKVYKFVSALRVDRIGIADTLGSAMNWEIKNIIQKVKKYCSADIEIHFHNDLGQAVTNSLTAIESGANWADTTLLGIGERTGITALSLFLSNLYVLDHDIISKYNLQYLTPAENYVAEACRIEVPFNLITNKINGFAHKAGIHLNALIKHGPQKYELFAPHIIGNKRQLIYNTNISGKTTQQDVEKFYKLYGQ